MALDDFLSDHGLKGTFGVVKLWPNMQVAEDEVIARLKVAASKIGVQCLEITPDGKYLNSSKYATREEMDFAIHLHFETPKAYDLHSFVALWNPLEFYFIMRPGVGYRPYSENLITHDDFLSCGSPQADDHVRRQLVKYGPRPGPDLTMFHSLADPIIEPTLGAKKIFYVGINWERVGGRKSRHQDILNLLDETNTLWIYGPEQIHGIKVWDGFKSYIGSIPFDGYSVIERIAEAGIVLVLSSESHKDAEMMSNRLFEGLAAGAVIIADENPFARAHFGDTLLYIDTTLPPRKVTEAIRIHVEWIRKNPKDALALARRAQDIFKAKFTLDRSLETIYRRLPEKLAQAMPKPTSQPKVKAYFLLPTGKDTSVERHVRSAEAQIYENLECIMLVDDAISAHDRLLLERSLKKSSRSFSIQTTEFTKPGKGRKKRNHPIGRILYQLYAELAEGEHAIFIEENESIFSDHIAGLLAALQRSPDFCCAYSAMVTQKKRPEREVDPILHVLNEFSLFARNVEEPIGMGRFLIRKDARQQSLSYVLPYLQTKAMATFVLDESARVSSERPTMMRQLDDLPDADAVGLDNEILMDYLPEERWKQDNQQHSLSILAPERLSLHNLTRPNKLQIVKDLFEELPIPQRGKKLVLYIYHRLARR